MIVQSHGPFKQLVLNDPSQKMLERARYRLRNEDGVDYENHLTENLPFEESRFTKVLCLNSFHYYVDQEEALSNIKKVLNRVEHSISRTGIGLGE